MSRINAEESNYCSESNPLISIITVVYNGEEFLEDTIQSVINQDYKNIEYIIIDGGSTDGTIDIIKKYEDQIDYWVSELDTGIYDAMNKGIELATGEWMNFMNAGDLFHSTNTLNKVFKSQYSNQVGVIYGNVNFIYDNDSKIIENAKAFLSESDFKNVPPFNHQSAFIRSCIHKEERYKTIYRTHADHYFFYSQFKKGVRFKYINMVISDFDRNGVSTKLTISQIKERYQICSELNADFSKFIFCLRYTKSIIKKLFKKIIPIKLFHKLEVCILNRQ